MPFIKSISHRHYHEYRELHRSKKVVFFCNGDPYYTGKVVRITPNRYLSFNDLLNDLSSRLPTTGRLPHGVRQIFTPVYGHRLKSITELQDGGAYVCGGFEIFKALKYSHVLPPEPWKGGKHPDAAAYSQDYASGPYKLSHPDSEAYANFAGGFHPNRHGGPLRNSFPFSSQRSSRHAAVGGGGAARPGLGGQGAGAAGGRLAPLGQLPGPGGEPARVHKPRLITVIRSGVTPRSIVKILLNRQGVQSFEHLLADISEAFGKNWRHDRVQRLFALSGREVHSVSAFFGGDVCFVATGEHSLGEAAFQDVLRELYNHQPSLLPASLRRKFEQQYHRLHQDAAANQHANTSTDKEAVPLKFSVSNKDSGFHDSESLSKEGLGEPPATHRAVVEDGLGQRHPAAFFDGSTGHLDEVGASGSRRVLAKLKEDLRPRGARRMGRLAPLPKGDSNNDLAETVSGRLGESALDETDQADTATQSRAKFAETERDRARRRREHKALVEQRVLDEDRRRRSLALKPLDGPQFKKLERIKKRREHRRRREELKQLAALPPISKEPVAQETKVVEQTPRNDLPELAVPQTDGQPQPKLELRKPTAPPLPQTALKSPKIETPQNSPNTNALSVSQETGDNENKIQNDQIERELSKKSTNEQLQASGQHASSAREGSDSKASKNAEDKSPIDHVTVAESVVMVTDAAEDSVREDPDDDEARLLSPVATQPQDLPGQSRDRTLPNAKDASRTADGSAKLSQDDHIIPVVDAIENQNDLNSAKVRSRPDTPAALRTSDAEKASNVENKKQNIKNSPSTGKLLPKGKGGASDKTINEELETEKGKVEARKENVAPSSPKTKPEKADQEKGGDKEKSANRLQPPAAEVKSTSEKVAQNAKPTPMGQAEKQAAANRKKPQRAAGRFLREISDIERVHDKYSPGRVLGDGNFAIVKHCKMVGTKHEYAMKIIDKAKLKGKEHMVESEIRILKICNHTHIVKLHEEYETKKEIILIMELVKGGDLFDAITSSVKFDEVTATGMVKDLTGALFYLHSRHIVHRDLKPENLLVYRTKDGNLSLKLADFGLAMEVLEPIFTVCGTPTYVAPEILMEIGYGLEVDLWALGVITYILLCGFPPFRSPDRSQTELFELIKSGDYEFLSPYWDPISPAAKDLIARLLIVHRKRRHTAIDVLCHPWIITRAGAERIGPEVVSEQSQVLRRNYELQARENLQEYRTRKQQQGPGR